MLQKQMDSIYRNMEPEKIPWNMDLPPDIIKNIVLEKRVIPCKTIELGCGIGNYVIYLAKNGFDTAGVDFSSQAIKMAKDKASDNNVHCDFFVGDVLGDLREVNGTFDFVYDWELLHHIFPENRVKYIKNVYRLLNPGGQYLSVCFSEESRQFGGTGKYRETPLETRLYFSDENEMKLLFDPYFHIQELETVDIEGKYAPHKAIYAFLKKKEYASGKRII